VEEAPNTQAGSVREALKTSSGVELMSTLPFIFGELV